MVSSDKKMTFFIRRTGGDVLRRGFFPSLTGGTGRPQEREDGQLGNLHEVQSFRYL